MSDDKPQQDAQSEATPAVVGEWLREAREAQSLGVEAVADALHLDSSIVDALEREAFAQLGATVFAKGHLRAVASYLGLDEVEADARFAAVSGIGKDDLPELIVQYNRPLRAPSRLPVIAGLVVAAIIVAAGLFYAGMQLARGSAQTGAQTTANADAALATGDDATLSAISTLSPPSPAASQSSAGEPAQGASPAGSFADKLSSANERAASSPASQTQTTVTQTPSPATAPASSVPAAGGLRLSFNDECWFEVRDASDRRIAYGTARAGTERVVTGQRPFAVTLGVANAVVVSVDGEPFTVSAAMRRGRAAKFSIP